MRQLAKTLLAVGAVPIFLSGLATAQLGAPHAGSELALFANSSTSSYDHHWAPMHGAPTASWSGKPLFEAAFGTPAFGTPTMQTIRICYGIDSTQGGQNWSGFGSTTPGPNGAIGDQHAGGGRTENTWFRVIQGFTAVAIGTPQAGVEMGLVSVQAGTSSRIDGDNCFTPFNKGASDSGGHEVGAAAIGGLFPGTGVAAAPGIFWEFTFNWAPTPVFVANKIASDINEPGFLAGQVQVPARGLGNPLLSNVIFEVQGPLNGVALGFIANQYYLSSTIEWAGVQENAVDPVLGFRGSGGVTNGNSNWGSGIFGTTAGITNAVSATRFLGLTPTGAFISMNFRIQTPLVQQGTSTRAGRVEFMGSLAFATPRAWAYHNFDSALGSRQNFHVVGDGHNSPKGAPGSLVTLEGRDGSNGNELIVGNGGPDWRISSAPISNVDVIAIDHQAGADVNFNVYNVVGTYAYPDLSGSVSINFPSTYNPHAAAGFNTTNGTGGYYLGIPGIPCYLESFNRMAMLWSVTPSGAPMIQVPGSWDNQGPFIGIEGTAGYSVPTTREGFQTASINIDATTALLASNSALLFGTRFSLSDDFFADGALDYGGGTGGNVPIFSSLFQGGFIPMSSGQSDMRPNGGQIPISIPSPSLAGVPLYISMSGTHVDICNGGTFEVTEQYNALTIVLQ
ncbi:MAG: hypothetical protein ACI8TQ_002291 [Planctomycetota bacterium]|jgi:hypothetical protein